MIEVSLRAAQKAISETVFPLGLMILRRTFKVSTTEAIIQKLEGAIQHLRTALDNRQEQTTEKEDPR